MLRDEYTTDNIERFKEDIMDRVRAVSRLRLFLASPMASATLAAVLMVFASVFCSFGDIFSNTMSQAEWGGRFSYAYSSVLKARMTVQVLALLTGISLFILSTKLLYRLRIPAYTVGNFIVSHSPLKFLRS